MRVLPLAGTCGLRGGPAAASPGLSKEKPSCSFLLHVSCEHHIRVGSTPPPHGESSGLALGLGCFLPPQGPPSTRAMGHGAGG